MPDVAAVDLRSAEQYSSDPHNPSVALARGSSSARHRARRLRRLLVACLASAVFSCGDAQHTVGVHDVSLAGASGMRAEPPNPQAGIGGVSGAPIDDGSVSTFDAAIPDANPACASGVTATVPKAVGLYLLLDTNFIARGNEHWPKVVQGITDYSRRMEARGTSLGLRIIDPPLITPSLNIQDWIEDACVPDRYNAPSVPVGPLPANVDAISGALSRITLSLTTPLKAALEGALIYSSSLKDAHPEEDKALVVLTDGFLDLSCATNAQDLAGIAQRYRERGVPSYMVELLVPPPEIWPLPITIPLWQQGTLIPLDPVARAGGTGAARSLDMETGSAADLSDTLLEIQRHASGCAYWLPSDKTYEEVLLAVDTGFGPGPLPRLSDVSECGANGAYIAEEGSPPLVRACPESCTGILATGRPPIWIDDCDLE